MVPVPPDQKVAPPREFSFEELYAEHADQVFVWATRYSRGRRAWAEDVVHEVFVKVWEHRARLHTADVRGWLFRVTQNVAFSTLRRELTVAGWVASLLSGGEARETAPTPHELLEGRQAIEGATAVLDRLPGQERVVMAMRLIDDLSQRQIAEVLSLSEGYVSKLLTRARARLESWGWKVE
jgi:RNA polymerase sigma-70 factor (ECF subfamily)